MDFFEKMMDSFSTASQDVAKKAKNATESVKLNNQMRANERMIKKLIYQVGLLCFENQGKESMEYDELFQEIHRLKNENSQLQDEILDMSAEKICPQCGFGNDTGVNFCVRCGTNLRNIEVTTGVSAETTDGKICANCGSVNETEALFCIECGTKFKNTSLEEIEDEINDDA